MKKGMPITIYSTSDFMGSVTKVEAKLIEIGRKNYAQYDNAPFVSFIPKGKRTGYIKRATYAPYLLVIAGWGHPTPQDWMTDPVKSASGMTVRESRYTSFDDRYKTDFDGIINPYLEGKEVLVDLRTTAGKEVVNEFTDNNASAPETNKA